MPRESAFEARVVKRLKAMPECVEVLKNDSSLVQGISDRTAYFTNGFWAWLEFKANANAAVQPNQQYYVDLANSSGAFGAFIYPENEDEVFDAIQRALSN